MDKSLPAFSRGTLLVVSRVVADGDEDARCRFWAGLVFVGPDSVILSPTPPTFVVRGQSLNITCATECNPPCSYSWTLGSQHITSDSMLTLTDINWNQTENSYMCTAKNVALDTTRNKEFLLVVHNQALTLNSQSTKVTVDELTPMTLRCEVNGNPGSHIKLLNNSHILHEVKNSTIAEYAWDEAGCLDTGRYICDTENNTKSAVELVVKCSPRLDHRVPFRKIFPALVGGDAILMVSVIANPAPSFTWYKLTDGKVIHLGSGKASTTDTTAVGDFIIRPVKQEDSGVYQVIVSNGVTRQNLVINVVLSAKDFPENFNLLAVVLGTVLGLLVVLLLLAMAIYFCRMRNKGVRNGLNVEKDEYKHAYAQPHAR
ncbi:carcinoembryonic antigen-related cell adhesion molecule 2-like [Gigantopelta aegis]|uniref:carcinoembryonic antigen-related cell adhesion molecule 2-like n=1 Tax=Gigantopelta aegis TaxID=1735272 RepID=UPI001B88AD8E|nr:carcinoembryonic antigen-related cell adhesion molecule 2-like [Gigantopelta aegis]